MGGCLDICDTFCGTGQALPKGSGTYRYGLNAHIHAMQEHLPIRGLPLTPGQLIARGVCRHLRTHDFVTVEELLPAPGLRVDVMRLARRGSCW